MLLSYLGALKSLIYTVLFRICTPSPAAVRLPVLLAGGLTICLFYAFLHVRPDRGRRWSGCLLLLAGMLCSIAITKRAARLTGRGLLRLRPGALGQSAVPVAALAAGGLFVFPRTLYALCHCRGRADFSRHCRLFHARSGPEAGHRGGQPEQLGLIRIPGPRARMMMARRHCLHPVRWAASRSGSAPPCRCSRYSCRGSLGSAAGELGLVFPAVAFPEMELNAGTGGSVHHTVTVVALSEAGGGRRFRRRGRKPSGSAEGRPGARCWCW